MAAAGSAGERGHRGKVALYGLLARFAGLHAPGIGPSPKGLVWAVSLPLEHSREHGTPTDCRAEATATKRRFGSALPRPWFATRPNLERVVLLLREVL
jgi:hypothetical protein